MGADLLTYRLYGKYQNDIIMLLKTNNNFQLMITCNEAIGKYTLDKELMKDDKLEFLFFFEVFLGISYDLIGNTELAKKSYNNILNLPEYEEEALWINYARIIANTRIKGEVGNIGYNIDKIIATYND